MDNITELTQIIKGCQMMERMSQERLYNLFYNYAMSVATRYMRSFEEAEEVTNDTFVKVFTYIDSHFRGKPPDIFKTWLRRILINTALDKIKLKSYHHTTNELHEDWQIGSNSDIIEKMTRDQVLFMVQRLPTQYRTVFNLHVVDGYSHVEIADMLSISEGTSKSNLSRARQQLKLILNEQIY
jgi:RNA polymerase sigma-70 factor (ECF subfamily)